MSADNGIYIVQIPTADGGTEWRVAHCQNIEDCYADDTRNNHIMDSDEMIDSTRVMKFGEAPIFETEEETIEYAWKLYKEVLDDFGVVEYGVCLAAPFDRALPGWSVDYAEIVNDKLWQKWEEDKVIKDIIE